MPGREHPYTGASSARVLAIFLGGAAVTLAAGVVLQDSGDVLAGRIGLQGAVFGATFLAAASALPELSSGIAAVRLGDMQLAVSDILGGNSFQITLFLLADLLAGTPVIVAVHHSDVWLGSLGLVLTGIAAVAIIGRPQRTFLRLGIDSITMLVIYAAGIALLTQVAK
jgi:cation:H+ antiporter